jgi:hypothetical protein
MREIKFRAWDNGHKHMRTDILIGRQHGGAWVETYEGNVFEGEVMQYTGLKDRNGKDIYEGDLVRYATHDVLIVEYRAPAFALRDPNAEDYWQWSAGLEGVGGSHPVDIEVIGNIWDTPELREAES